MKLQIAGCKVIGLSEVENGALKGNRAPTILTHIVQEELLKQLLIKIVKLEEDLQFATEMSNGFQFEAESFKKDYNEVKSLLAQSLDREDALRTEIKEWQSDFVNVSNQLKTCQVMLDNLEEIRK